MAQIDDLSKINLDDFKREAGAEEPPKDEPEFPPKEEPPKEEPGYVEISIPTEMLVALVGAALSMRYLPDGAAVKAFHKKYREELPKIIQSFGLKEVFDEVLASTLCFKIEKSEMLEIPLPAWAGVVAVIGLLVVSGFFIKVPTTKGKGKEEKGGEGEPKT